MLMNNLDPDVAERPGELVVYGGIGRAARDWNAFDRIVATLRRLEADETLLVQSGKPVGVFRTHADAPRVLIANSNLVPHWATWDHFNELDRKGLMMYGQMTAGSWIYIGSQGIVQGTYETFVEMGRQHYGGVLAGRWILTAGLGGMGGAQPLRRRWPAPRCSPSNASRAGIEMRLRTGYLDVAGEDARRGARDHRALDEGDGKAGLGRPARQRRRRACPSWCGAASGPTSSPTRPRRTIRSTAICRRAGRLQQWEERRATRSQGRRARRRARRWPSTCARCSTSTTPASRPSTTATTSARWRSRRASRTPSTSRASCPPISARCSAAASGRSAGPRCRATPRTSISTDAKVKELMPDDPHLHNWLDMARARIKFQGLPARICWVGLGDRHRLGLAFNEMVASGELKAPIVIGRDHLDSGSVASPNRETEAMRDGSDAVSDWPLLNALLNCASGATWVSLHHGGGVGMGFSQHAGMVIVCRRHAGSRAPHRPRAVERPGDRRHAPRRRRLRRCDRLREGEGARPAEPGVNPISPF